MRCRPSGNTGPLPSAVFTSPSLWGRRKAEGRELAEKRLCGACAGWAWGKEKAVFVKEEIET